MDICSRNEKLAIRRPAILVALALLLCSCKSTPPESMVTPPAGSKPPATTQQSSQPMRGIWLATVSRLDWPPVSSVNNSNPTSRARVQQQAMIDKLDHLQRLGINTVFFQVKPDGTALWPSKILPWSDLMTGKIGENPGYDPLQFMLDEAHKRGMKVHAWFNPYRVSVNTKPGTIRELNSTLSQQPASVYVQHRDWIRTSGDRFVLDPGIPEVQDWITSIVAEVVSRYPVDGVQFDDYFYTESPGSRLNDNETYRKYGGAFASKADWRRNNTQQLIAKADVNDIIFSECTEVGLALDVEAFDFVEEVALQKRVHIGLHGMRAGRAPAPAVLQKPFVYQRIADGSDGNAGANIIGKKQDDLPQ